MDEISSYKNEKYYRIILIILRKQYSILIYQMKNILKNKYDAIIIGAGHNGLVAANYLSAAKKNVLILQQRHLVGGAALTEELLPGFKFSRCSYVLSLFRKNIIKQLDLFNKGLKIHYRDIPSLTPTREVDKYLIMYKNQQKTIEEIAKFSKKDAEIYPKYEQYLSQFCSFWDKNVDSIPYNSLNNPSLKDKFNFLANSYQKNLDYFDFGRFLTCSVEQMLDNWFQSDILKASLATDGIIGQNLSVKDHSTAYVLLHHVMGELEEGKQGQWGYVEGGNGRLSEILAESAKQKGATIQLNSKVEQILFNGQKTKGVKLADGQVIQSNIILSNCTNKVTFFNLVKQPEKILPRSTYNKLKNIQYNGAATKLNIVLKKLPKFKSFRNHQLPPQKLLQGTIHINCQSMQQLKDAFEQTKTQRMSMNPFMDITIPSIFDKTMCPEGYYIMNCFLQYTPYHSNMPKLIAKEGRIPHEQIKQIFLKQINQYLDQPLDIHFMDILTPHDLQDLISLTQGNIFHGSIGIQNLFTNRLSGKVGGIWICGSSAHPGGGVMGAIGKQVAQRILLEKQI